jgi:hypothetical protein
MALPVTIPNEFANATASIPLSQLDTNFTTLANAVNGISDGSETLANASVTVLTAGTANVTTLNTSGQVVFNDAGADVDFRVEGDTDANLLFVDASADKVGIGTNAPDRKLVVLDSVDDNLPAAVITKTALTGANSGLQVHTNEASASGGSFGFRVTSGSTYDSPTNEIIRVNQHGLCFNGDTAAANALDDYEEGTWTPNITSSGGGSGTGTDKAGTYTKIGRMVYASGYHVLTNKTGINAGQVRVEGLPFNASALWVGGVTFNTLNSIVQTGVQTNGGISSNFISLANVLNNGTQTAINVTELTNTSGIYFSVFYQV